MATIVSPLWGLDRSGHEPLYGQLAIPSSIFGAETKAAQPLKATDHKAKAADMKKAAYQCGACATFREMCNTMITMLKVGKVWPMMLPMMMLFVACGGETMEEKMNRKLQEAVNTAAETVAGQQVDVNELDQRLREAVSGLDSAKFNNVEPVNFRELKKILPAEINGMPRSDESGETSNMMGIGISTTEARYGTGSPSMLVKVTDTGGAGVLLLSLASFTNLNIDKEGPEGSERTLEIDGHKAIEKVRKNGGALSSSLTVMVDQRFIVSLEGQGMDAAPLAEAFRKMDLSLLPKPESTSK